MPAVKKKIIKKTPQPTDEEKLLGETVKEEKQIIIDYESPEAKYKVRNLKLKNTPITVNGTVIETFIGGRNIEARKSIKNGAKTVTTYDPYTKEALFKIEVL